MKRPRPWSRIDVPPREEVLGDERRAAGVRGEDGRPRGRGPVVAGVRAPRLAVEDPPEPEAARGLATLDGGPERAAPETLRRAGGEGGLQLPPLGLDPGKGRRIEVDHTLRQRELLRRERAGPHSHRPCRERAAVLRHARPSDPPADRAGPDVEVDTDQRRNTVPRREQCERAAVPLPADVRGRARHQEEDDVARLRARWRDRHAHAAGRSARGGRRRRRRTQERAAGQADQEGPAPHSCVGPGGCWRRKRSISATRSLPSGRSPAGGGSASSAS